MGTKSFTFNSTPYTLGPSLRAPSEEDLPMVFFKYAPIDYVRENSNAYVNHVLNNMPIQHKHRRVLVDVKLHDLNEGDVPCIPGWHCDSIVDPFHKSRPEVHHIFVTGAGCLTEFMKSLVELNIEKDDMFNSLRRQLKRKQGLETFHVDSCRIMSYSRFSFHRGVSAKKKEKRLLIRVTESDIIKPSIKKTTRLGLTWPTPADY